VRGQYSRFPTALPGDTILLAGENWSRHDFSVLRELKKNRKVHIAAVLQDMIPCIHPQFFEAGSFKTRFQAYVEFLSTSADVIFTISKSTTEDFLRFASGVSPMRIVQIELGVDVLGESTQSRPAAIAALGNRSYVLCVSTIQSRKNFDLLYRIWQRFALERQPGAPHLVVVGRPGFGSADLLNMIRNDPWIADSITLIQEASDAELGWLYAHCLFTLYPSWYEGWGLPLTESLAYGKTFIASDRSSLPEAGQGLGIHLDPYDLVSWSGELMRLANDGETRAAMEQRILAVRRVPNWSDTARKISAVLEELIYARETTTG
jgi:glycosyltransferase involved in cell wall biosynthesis